MNDKHEKIPVAPEGVGSAPKTEGLAGICAYTPPRPISKSDWNIKGRELKLELLYSAKGVEIARYSANNCVSYAISARLARDIKVDEIDALQRTLSGEWNGNVLGKGDMLHALVSSPHEPNDAYEGATLLLDILRAWGLVNELPWHKETYH